MKQGTATINGRDFTQITAEQGKVLIRITDELNRGGSCLLGMEYRLKPEPFLELPEHYREDDDPNPEPPTEAEKNEALTILGVKL